MDAFGHVNNVVYFQYFEAARIEFLTRVGWMASKDRTGHGPIVHSTSARYRRPLNYPDELRVGGRVTELRIDRVTIEHVIWSNRQNAIVAEGQVVVVNFDYRAGAKAPIPGAVRAAILNVDKAAKT